MPQKILAGRADDPLTTDVVRAKIDQVILANEPFRTLREAAALGLKKTKVETTVAYETQCVSVQKDSESLRATPPISREVLRSGVLLARAGIGFPPAVHLERFAAPGRLALTDDPRAMALGGIGMLTLTAAPPQLADALLEGYAQLRCPRSIQILLSGKLRPFSSVKDAALELLGRDLEASVRKVDSEFDAPVVLEFAGPSARLLSVPERAVLCSLAPLVSAAGAVFVSDEKTEVYLRDQRRSKAHRVLAPDAGAPCDDVITLDLSTVDPLLLDEDGVVRGVRELEGKPVSQVVLGGDSGTSLRDLLVAAALLKSKRVPPSLDFLIAPPSRQVLEVLAQNGAIVDLIATGARLLEPDQRILSGELYPPGGPGVSLRSFDSAFGTPGPERAIVASAETLAYAVAHGVVGDPRAFKRPVRVTTPRSLPTDDVLIVRKEKSKKGEPKRDVREIPQESRLLAFAGNQELLVATATDEPERAAVLLVPSCERLRWLSNNPARLPSSIKALISPFVLSGQASLFSGVGIIVLRCTMEQCRQLSSAKSIRFPALSQAETDVEISVAKSRITLKWLAVEEERRWVLSGKISDVTGKPRTTKSAALG